MSLDKNWVQFRQLGEFRQENGLSLDNLGEFRQLGEFLFRQKLGSV